MKKLTGTFRKSRSNARLVHAHTGTIVRPAFLIGRAADLWDERIAKFEAAQLDVAGCERMLAHLCALDAAMEAMWERGETPTAAMVSALRTLSSLFYETPASQIGKPPLAPSTPSPFDEFIDNFPSTGARA